MRHFTRTQEIMFNSNCQTHGTRWISSMIDFYRFQVLYNHMRRIQMLTHTHISCWQCFLWRSVDAPPDLDRLYIYMYIYSSMQNLWWSLWSASTIVCRPLPGEPRVLSATQKKGQTNKNGHPGQPLKISQTSGNSPNNILTTLKTDPNTCPTLQTQHSRETKETCFLFF